MTSYWSVYDKDHMSELRIKNTSESDPVSYVVTNKQLQIKPRKNSEAPTGLRDTGAMLYRLGY